MLRSPAARDVHRDAFSGRYHEHIRHSKIIKVYTLKWRFTSGDASEKHHVSKLKALWGSFFSKEMPSPDSSGDPFVPRTLHLRPQRFGPFARTAGRVLSMGDSVNGVS